jgi:hypothetical protein
MKVLSILFLIMGMGSLFLGLFTRDILLSLLGMFCYNCHFVTIFFMRLDEMEKELLTKISSIDGK